MPKFKTSDDLGPRGKTVLLRADLNVPMDDGKVGDTTRIERTVPTIRELTGKGAKVVVLSHFGRPKGRRDPGMSLKPVAEALSKVLGSPVAVGEDCVGPDAGKTVGGLSDGGLALLGTLRLARKRVGEGESGSVG